MPLIIPNGVENLTPADAVELQQNYDAIQLYVNTSVIQRDGSVGMAAPLLLAGAPTGTNQAANKGYVDTKLDKDGGTMTGDLNLPAAGISAGSGLGALAGQFVSQLDNSNGNVANVHLWRQPFNVGHHLANFYTGAGQTLVGSISVASGTTCAYNTSSGADTKERVADADDALDAVRALGAAVYRGRFIADNGEGRQWHLLNAEDCDQHAPYAVMNDPEVGWQMDRSALVPVLLAAVSQLAARVTELEARL